MLPASDVEGRNEAQVCMTELSLKKAAISISVVLARSRGSTGPDVSELQVFHTMIDFESKVRGLLRLTIRPMYSAVLWQRSMSCMHAVTASGIPVY